MEMENSCDRFPLDESALGVPDQVHRVSPRVISLCWLAALACLVAAAMVVSLLSKRLGTTVPLRHAMLLGAALLTESLVPIVMALHFSTVAYLVFRDGLVHVRGSRRTIVRWDEITDVFEKRTYRGTRYRIVLSDGRTRSITPILTSHDELGATIVARVTERVTPQVLRFCENGGTASFPLAVSADPATSRSTEVAWGQITRLQLAAASQMTSVQTTGAVDDGRNTAGAHSR